jgi:histo-blood group ABO system transferase
MSDKKNIGILIIATGKYDQFIPPLYKSIEKFFCTNHNVKMFVFTDGIIPENSKIEKIYQEHTKWPNPTLKRYHIFDKHSDFLSKMDYLYYLDADMRVVAPIGEEIFPDTESELVGTEHPGFFGGRRGTYDTNPDSTAYVGNHEGTCYYAGGFNGGTSEAFLKMSRTIKENINKDLIKEYIAIWHDESHLNRYFIDNPPKKLSPSYCYPESWNLPFEKKILALDKNHSDLRN